MALVLEQSALLSNHSAVTTGTSRSAWLTQVFHMQWTTHILSYHHRRQFIHVKLL